MEEKGICLFNQLVLENYRTIELQIQKKRKKGLRTLELKNFRTKELKNCRSGKKNIRTKELKN